MEQEKLNQVISEAGVQLGYLINYVYLYHLASTGELVSHKVRYEREDRHMSIPPHYTYSHMGLLAAKMQYSREGQIAGV